MISRIESWFMSNGWTVFDFQRRTWDAYLRRESGLVHAPTGMGKTYAVALGPVIEWWDDVSSGKAEMPAAGDDVPLTVLWITPLRALAGDSVKALAKPLEAMKIPWTVSLRTGDTTTSVRQKQRDRPPTILVITPENLSLMLSYPETEKNFHSLRCIIVDEWHELLGTKRGVQTELALARLRRWIPDVRTWGLSATLGNTDQAMQVLLGKSGTLISGDIPKEVIIETLLPADITHFPWAGHSGTVMLPQVLPLIEKANSTLLFTNTRSQAELWYRAILLERPQWAETIALHHGSLEKDLRKGIELQLHAGHMRCVVCTSSLDLGVDFSPVDQVMQLGAPKGVARLLQRAGRSNHQPGRPSRIICIPTQAFEMVEFIAAREAQERHEIESRRPLDRPLDVLVQHLVTIALGSGFREAELFDEVRTTFAYRNLSKPQWDWALDFVRQGGPTLHAYPQFQRVARKGLNYRVIDRAIGHRHRLSIGTITSDSMLRVQLQRGQTLGMVEEHFINSLNPGEAFTFAGHTVEVIGIKDMTVVVKRSSKKNAAIPRWMGGRLPLSSELARAVRRKLDEAKHGFFRGVEMEAVQPMLEIQAAGSIIPSPDELLIERTKSREGHHLFVYPFEGRLVHQGLSALLAYRLARALPQTIRVGANDYGMELLSQKPWTLSDDDWRRHLSPERLTDDLLLCLNATQMARSRFRDIARVAGLVFQGYPGANKSSKQLQASSSLFYDVFMRYDPENLLLEQARREVLEAQLEYQRMKETLEKLSVMSIVQMETERFSPLAFPIYSERLQQSQVSTEKWSDRIQRMTLERQKMDVLKRDEGESDEDFVQRWKRMRAAVPDFKSANRP